jgi:UDP-glucose 4-epimerase
MRILVTGGCGFIGVNLVAFLRQHTAHEPVVFDNLVSGKREYLEGFEAEFVEGDIRDAGQVGPLMKRVDAVIHLAADTRVIPSIENPDFNFEVNVLGTYNLLNEARKAGVERFVFASTGGAIVGEVTPPVHEGMPPRPISPYGASKLCGEAYCSAFAGSYGMKTCSLRFSNVYGPRSFHKGSVVALFFKQILRGEKLVLYGDGGQTRDFVYAEDLCGVICRALEVSQGGGVFQLGTGVETSVNRLVALIRECVGGRFPFACESAPARRGEVLRSYCDISRAREELGYDPRVALPAGLQRTWEWFAANRERFA